MQHKTNEAPRSETTRNHPSYRIKSTPTIALFSPTDIHKNPAPKQHTPVINISLPNQYCISLPIDRDPETQRNAPHKLSTKLRQREHKPKPPNQHSRSQQSLLQQTILPPILPHQQ